jgi:hypothetical protein
VRDQPGSTSRTISRASFQNGMRDGRPIHQLTYHHHTECSRGEVVRKEEKGDEGGEGHTGQIEIILYEIFMYITEVIVAR